MIFHQLAALFSSLTAEIQRQADAAEQRMHLLIVQPILTELHIMAVDVSKLTADFSAFRTDLTTTLADARAKMDELLALKVSDADAQTAINALDASLGDLEAQVKPPASPVTSVPVEVPPVVPTPAVPAPVSTDPAAPAPVTPVPVTSADPSAPPVVAAPVDPTAPVPATDPTATVPPTSIS